MIESRLISLDSLLDLLADWVIEDIEKEQEAEKCAETGGHYFPARRDEQRRNETYSKKTKKQADAVP